MAGKDIFVVILGGKWAEAGVYSQILAVWTFFVFISTPLNNLSSVFERQEINLILNVIIFVTRVIALLIGGLLKNVFLTMWLFALTGILTSGWYILWALRISGVKISTSILTLLKSLLISSPFLAVVGLGVWVFQLRHLYSFILSAIMALLYYTVVVVRDPILKGMVLSLRTMPNPFRKK